MNLYRHAKGGLYRILTRRLARAPLYTGERVVVKVAQGEVTAEVTDSIGLGGEFVVYQDVSAPEKIWARPAEMFDDGRFTRLEGSQP